MTVTCDIDEAGIAVVTMANPPVNAITVGDTWAIRDTFAELSSDGRVRAVILTATGKGFNAGIDIKEMQASGEGGFDFLLSSGDACHRAFDQIYQTPVPVIAAVNDFCMGLGVGLVGSCDMIVATRKARFGLPEVDNGALGCASHLAKLVPPMKLRQMTLTCEPVDAETLHSWGSICELADDEAELMEIARALAGRIAEKRGRAVRAAKSGLNGIDSFDLSRNYRLEQGYTYELNLQGDGSSARDEFVAGERIVTR